MVFRPKRFAAQQRSVPDVLLLVYPHSGVVDSWLPILFKLKRQRNHVTVGAIISPKALESIDPTDFVMSEAKKVIDLVMVSGDGQKWITMKTFKEARSKFKTSKSWSFYQSLCGNVTTTKMLVSSTKVVLFDIMQMKVKTIKNLQAALPRAQWFSLPHGIDRVEAREYLRDKIMNKIGHEAPKGVMVYASSDDEAKTYSNWFGIEDGNVKVVGIPRHTGVWIENVCQTQPHPWTNGRYIFIASKAASAAFFPTQKKLQALSQVATVAEEVGAAVIVRLHPSEGAAESDIYKAALGAEKFGKTWTFSALHPIALGGRALCVVTFHSSVAIDMAAIGVPVIEVRDFSDLSESPKLTRDEHGNPISTYQQRGLVLGARNQEELRRHVLNIVADRETVANGLRHAYERAYKRVPDAIDLIVRDVENALDRT
jgi:hypothetical protein